MKEFYWNGERCRYTGATMDIHNTTWHEYVIANSPDPHRIGRVLQTPRAPKDDDPDVPMLFGPYIRADWL